MAKLWMSNMVGWFVTRTDLEHGKLKEADTSITMSQCYFEFYYYNLYAIPCEKIVFENA
jgi:hypothetical protein